MQEAIDQLPNASGRRQEAISGFFSSSFIATSRSPDSLESVNSDF